MSASSSLDALFAAERELRRHEAALLQKPKAELETLLSGAVQEAIGLFPKDEAEATLRAERLADLCAQIPGAKMADAMLELLNAPEPSVRAAAGEALLDVAYERYAEVARAIERAYARGLQGPALQEIPWLLAEVGEPSALPLMRPLLQHADPEVVASTVEALVQLGDPGAIDDLQSLAEDERKVRIEELDDEVLLGDLATDAITELASRGESSTH